MSHLALVQVSKNRTRPEDVGFWVTFLAKGSFPATFSTDDDAKFDFV